MKINKCKVDVKEKDGKMIMSQRGHCDERNPNKIVNRDIEFDIGSMESSMKKLVRNFEE